MTKVLTCKNACKPHPFQDKKYNGRRVMNSTSREGEFRCTVCGGLSKEK